MEHEEHLRLTEMERLGVVEPNLEIAEKLHQRSVKRKSNNHKGNFKPQITRTTEFEPFQH